MDDVHSVIDDCAALHLRLDVRGSHIVIIGPRVAREAVADRVRAAKPALLHVLRGTRPMMESGGVALLADVLALAEARGYPRLAAGGHSIAGQGAWLWVMRDLPRAELCIVRAALRAAQRRDGPGSTEEIDLDEAAGLSPPW